MKHMSEIKNQMYGLNSELDTGQKVINVLELMILPKLSE